MSPWNGEHGYSAYSNGHCRCGVCTAAKAAYRRSVRAAARRAANEAQERGERHVVHAIRHGLSGYMDKGCRCQVCVSASTADRARRKKAAS